MGGRGVIRTTSTLNMNWFYNTFGFQESTGVGYGKTKAMLEEMYDEKDHTLNGGKVGLWEFTTLTNLRAQTATPKTPADDAVRYEHITGEAKSMHGVEENTGAMFQAASQFNCLEFPSPCMNPEHGVTNYVLDKTQGPACAVACPYGTAFRNYLLPRENGTIGQTKFNQLDGLRELGERLGNDDDRYWRVANGYLDASHEQLRLLNKKLNSLTESERDDIMGHIKVGSHYDTQSFKSTLVGQCYCAAAALSYSRCNDVALWEPFSQLILDAIYEATLRSAVKYHDMRVAEAPAGSLLPPQTVFLTKVGGGVFGNEHQWIRQAIERALTKVREEKHSLDVKLVHFQSVCDEYLF
eukprot:TRINITY_DN544_c1_g1_i1.p1 TRINITY_DN544_c1_g1~~TRINITY_DN544_c1_g1_i1.p1  ORF type:complete len:353 (+),score=49.87 TRINITY_DN544_c1_g1_i1:27-1085(+)